MVEIDNNIMDEGFDNISISDSIKDLMGGNSDMTSLMSGFGGFDLKSMLPQILMGALGQNDKYSQIGRMFSELSSVGGNYNDDDGFLQHQRTFEENIKPRGTEQLRGIIPYLEPSMQRHFAVYIKLMELQGVVNYYTKTQLPYVARDDNWQRSMLLSMRHFGDNGNKMGNQPVSQIEKCLKLMDMYKVMQNFGGVR